MFEPASVPLQPLSFPWPDADNVHTSLLRLDALHPHYGGNKWFKLKFNLEQSLAQGYRRVLTFGGAYSNHLRAAASAAKDFNLELVCVVRGEKTEPLNPVLQHVIHQGGSVFYVSREDYKRKEDPSFIQSLLDRFGPAYVIPEGGSNAEGVMGCTGIVSLINDFDCIVCACGTFTTLAGLSLALRSDQEAIGISVLKAGGYGDRQVSSLVEKTLLAYPDVKPPVCKISVIDDYHFGGYAKQNAELKAFMEWMKTSCNVDTDFVYTAKLLYGVKDLIDKKYFRPGSRVVVVYSNVPSFETLNQ